MQDDILKILEYGVMAPSGDNSQPWEFSLKGNELSIYNLPNKDNLYLNYNQSGSLIAHGALLENIFIASNHLGYSIEENILPGEENLVAILKFEKTRPISHDLFKCLSKRCTNRLPYKTDKVSEEIIEELKKARFEDIGIKIITDRKKMEDAAEGGSDAEEIILENKILHNYLFKDVVWTENQNIKTKSGLYIKTMEFNPVQKTIFWLVHYWSLMKIAILVKFPSFIAREDAKLYASCSFIQIIYTHKTNSENFIKIGREMQRLWLIATKWGLQVQPMTATLFFNYRLRQEGDGSVLSKSHILKSKDAYQKIKKSFDLEDEVYPFIMFRMGYGDTPSAKTLRKKPVVKII